MSKQGKIKRIKLERLMPDPEPEQGPELEPEPALVHPANFNEKTRIQIAALTDGFSGGYLRRVHHAADGAIIITNGPRRPDWLR